MQDKPVQEQTVIAPKDEIQQIPLENLLKIRKATIKDELFLYVEYNQELVKHRKNDIKLTCNRPVHQDLKDAFQKLHVHLAIISDQNVKVPKKKDLEETEFEGFYVKGFTIGGNEEHEGVTLTGNFEGKYGTVNLNSPFTKWTNEDYPFINELSLLIDNCIHEVKEYILNGKQAPDQQLSMEFAGGNEDADNSNEKTEVTPVE